MSKLRNIKKGIFNNLLVKDSFWALLGSFFSKGIAYIAGIYIAKKLGNQSFGEYGIIKNSVISISILSTFGLSYTITKFIAEFKLNNPERIISLVRAANRLTLIISAIFAILIFVFSHELSVWVLKIERLSFSLRIISVWVILNALTSTQIGILSGLGSFKLLAKWNFIIGIFSFLTSLFFTFHFQLNGAISGLVISQFFQWQVYRYLLKKLLLPYGVSADKSRMKMSILFSFSLPVALQEMTYSIFSLFINFILVFYSNYKEIGTYSAVNQVTAFILFMPAILRNVFLMHLSKPETNNVKNIEILKQTILISSAITIIPAIIIVFFKDQIIQILGSSYYGVEDILLISTVTVVFLSAINVFSQWFLSIGENWLVFWLKLSRDILIVLFLVSFLRLGFQGAFSISWSMLIVNFLLLVSMVLFLPKYKKL